MWCILQARKNVTRKSRKMYNCAVGYINDARARCLRHYCTPSQLL